MVSVRSPTPGGGDVVVRYPDISNASARTPTCRIFIPGVQMDMGKDSLNALHYFLDDTSKFFSEDVGAVTPLSSLTPSSELLGSRYFIDSRQTSLLEGSHNPAPDIVLQLSIRQGHRVCAYRCLYAHDSAVHLGFMAVVAPKEDTSPFNSSKLDWTE